MARTTPNRGWSYPDFEENPYDTTIVGFFEAQDADVHSLATGVRTVALGGTGASTLTSGAYLKGAGTSAITTQAIPIPVADGGNGLVSLPSIAQGRLTTESGVYMSSADRTAQSTIFYTYYGGALISLYDGTRWKLYEFTERSLALSGLTTGKNYDVFIYDNAGTITLELSAAWTNDTTRADALAFQNGILVKSGTPTRRYIGTIRTTGTTTTEDSSLNRFVYNENNRVLRHLSKMDTTGHTYDGGYRYYNGDTSNFVALVVGQTLTCNLVVTTEINVTVGGRYAMSIALVDGLADGPAYTYSAIAGNMNIGANGVQVFTAGYHFVVLGQSSFSAGASGWIALRVQAFVDM